VAGKLALIARAAFAAVGLALSILPARAALGQSLQRLTVESFTLSSDAAHPQLEVPFHLIVRLRVRERVSQIENLELPILASVELLGDVRTVTADARGSLYVETIAVVAHASGALTIAPATLQAVDPRDGKAKQYYSNALTLHVVGGSLEPLQQGGSFALEALRLLGWIVLWVLGIACVLVLAAMFFLRRPSAPPPIVSKQPLPPSPPPPVSRRDRIADALTVLRAERTRASAVRVRSAIWQMVGASDGETLADVLQRPAAADPSTRDVLKALERAAFTYEADLPAALDDACAALERYLQ
jgi:hypothetical protein